MIIDVNLGNFNHNSLWWTAWKFNDKQQGEKPLTEFLLPDSVCDIASNSKSSDAIWFVLIPGQKVAESNEADHYGHIIPEGCHQWSLSSKVWYCLQGREI